MIDTQCKIIEMNYYPHEEKYNSITYKFDISKINNQKEQEFITGCGCISIEREYGIDDNNLNQPMPCEYEKRSMLNENGSIQTGIKIAGWACGSIDLLQQQKQFFESQSIFDCKVTLYGDQKQALQIDKCPENNFYQVHLEDVYFNEALFNRLFYFLYMLVLITGCLFIIYIKEIILFSDCFQIYLDVNYNCPLFKGKRGIIKVQVNSNSNNIQGIQRYQQTQQQQNQNNNNMQEDKDIIPQIQQVEITEVRKDQVYPLQNQKQQEQNPYGNQQQQQIQNQQEQPILQQGIKIDEDQINSNQIYIIPQQQEKQ